MFSEGRSFLLTVRSSLLTVGLCCLWKIGLAEFWLRFGLAFFDHGGKSAWFSSLTVPPIWKVGFSHLLAASPP